MSQLFVYGDSLKSDLVGIVVPNPETFVPWANERLGGDYGFGELVKNKKVCDALLESIDQVGREYGLNRWVLAGILTTWFDFDGDVDY